MHAEMVGKKEVCWLDGRVRGTVASQSCGWEGGGEDRACNEPMRVSSKDVRWTDVSGELSCSRLRVSNGNVHVQQCEW
jgi:hypothetical protein